MNRFRLVFFTVLLLFSGSVFAQSKYDLHLRAARASGIPPIKNYTHLKSLHSKKKLVRIAAARGYTIAKLTYSKPYLSPRASRVLRDIGIQFYNRSKKKTFTVTSVTRSLYDQKRLARVNSNAVTTKLSSHNYGVSFDLSYIRFNRYKAPNPRMEQLLQKILNEFQRAGKIHYIKEYREKCFHVTVR
ncbi:DUF5715 family protein [Niabella terrae]